MRCIEACRVMRRAVAASAISLLASCTVASSPGQEPCASRASPATDIPVATTPKGGVTYYVRGDGGNAAQCDGRTDAPYPGSGNARSCAWNSPQTALPESGAAKFRGGDILRIAAGTYVITQVMQPVPSGASPDAPTRIIGDKEAAPRLVGAQGIHRVLNLEGTANAEVGHLEITDGSDCVFRHPSGAASCAEGMPWARIGLYARESRNVWLHDLNIHGMAARGINAGGLTNWTVDRVKLNRNGTAGWDGNVGGDGSNSGRLVLRDMEIGWNGCGERIATGEPWACWAQQSGGYGDGLGTTETGGQWLLEDLYVHHNTSDGLDLRYLDGASTTTATLRRIHAVANAGNQVKIRGNALIEESVLVGHCSYFRGGSFMKEKDLCRSDGSTLQLVMTGNNKAVVRTSTLAGEGAALIGHSEGDASDQIEISRNLLIGFPMFHRPEARATFSAGKSPARIRYSGNVAWQVSGCPADSVCDRHPRLTGMSLASFNASPLAGSPVVGRAGASPCTR